MSRKQRAWCSQRIWRKSSDSLKVDGEDIERVGKFVYLVVMIMEDGRYVNEVKRRIELARKVFTMLKWLLCNRSLSFSIRMRMVKCYHVFSVLSYASETWTMNKLVVDRVKSFEMWVIRRMRRGSYQEYKSNADVLREAAYERQLFRNIARWKLRFFGHITRHSEFVSELIPGR